MRTRLFAAALAVFAAVPMFAAPSRFGSIVEAFDRLQAGAPVAVNNTTFTIGHMKLTMKNGVAAPVKAGDQTVAIFFKGDGTLDYDLGDGIDQPILNHNARGRRVKVEGKHVSTDVQEAMLYAAGTPLPALSGAAASDITADVKSHIEEFGRIRATPLVHGFLLQNLGAPSTKFVDAEIRSGREMYVYFYDGPESQNEGLVALRQSTVEDITGKKPFFPVVLSLQPIGRDRKAAPPQPVILTSVDYTLVADGDNAKLNVAEKIARASEQQKAIRLNLDSNYLPKLGAAYRTLHLLSITDAKGQSLPFSHRNDEVVIGLENTTGTMLDLNFSIEGDFLIRPNNDNAWQLGVTAWFPQPDLSGQFYTLHSVVKVKKPFIALAPGTTVKRGEEGDFNVVENVIDKPIQFAVVHAGKYEFTEDTRNGLTVRVASYAGKNDRAAKQLTNLSYQIIDYYQYFLGPFPFNEFNIIQVNTFGYGQAPPATMFITNEAFNSMSGEANKFFSQGINERFAHEIAHQYWGHVVKMPSGEEQWLTESFAEYSAALLIKKMKGQGQYERLINDWRQRAQDVASPVPIPLVNYLSGDGAGRDRQALLYFKGAYLLYTLHKELGDDQFLTFMKSYQKSFRWKFGTTNDVAGLLQFITKKNYGPFIDQYFWGTAMPQ